MSKFYVGQRVRVLIDYKFPHLVGAVGVVLKREDHAVYGETYWLTIEGHTGQAWYHDHAIEPLDDPRQLVSWSSMEHIWRPSLSVGAGSGK